MVPLLSSFNTCVSRESAASCHLDDPVSFRVQNAGRLIILGLYVLKCPQTHSTSWTNRRFGRLQAFH
jgi:hypothetical protein